jgi:8-amino-7-oxononanoate synthase
MINAARSFVFDTGLAPTSAAAAAEGCRVIAASPALIADLDNVATRTANGADVERSARPVQSIPIGEPEVAHAAAARLQNQGIVVGCFRPPSVPDGISRLRLTARATLDPAAAEDAAALAMSMIVTG